LKQVGSTLQKCFWQLMVILPMLTIPKVCPAWPAKVMAVPYADELKVMVDVRREVVRLYGIDCPIDPQPFGKEARLYTSKLCLGKMVDVKPIVRDQYDRIIAWVDIDGQSLNKELIRAGMAWWYRKYLPFELGLARLEKAARKAKIGLWADPAPMPPWEYQALPPGQPTGPRTKFSLGRRGDVRERIMSKIGPPKDIFGKAGSVRQRLINMRNADQSEEPNGGNRSK
jgi:endonuclease YncB( thermonuclease family)